jgi:hypothetical protein
MCAALCSRSRFSFCGCEIALPHIPSEARKRAEAMRGKGKGIDADALENTCNLSDAAFRLHKSGLSTKSWENIKVFVARPISGFPEPFTRHVNLQSMLCRRALDCSRLGITLSISMIRSPLATIR